MSLMLGGDGELKLPVLNLSDEAVELEKEQELGYVIRMRTDGGVICMWT